MLAAETIFEALRKGDTSAAAARDASRTACATSWAGDELWEVRNFHQAFDHGTLRRHRCRPASACSRGGRGFGVLNRLDAEPGHTQDATLNSPFDGEARSRRRRSPIDGDAHLRQARRRLQLGHRARGGPAGPPAGARHRHLHLPVRGRVRQPLPALLPGQRLRDGGRRRLAHRAAPADQRLATACTARPATSWTPTRSSPGCRPRAAAVRTTERCDRSLGRRRPDTRCALAIFRSAASSPPPRS